MRNIKKKPPAWVPDASDEFRLWPEKVRVKFLTSLIYLQNGQMPASAKFMEGNPGKSLIRLKHQHMGIAYRLILTAKHPDFLHILVAFIKKSPKGGETPHGISIRIEDCFNAAQQKWIVDEDT